MNSRWRVGIDLGGTKTEVILLDGANETQFRARISSPQGDYEATLNAIKELVEAAELRARSLDDYADHLARGLAAVINLLDPDVIVLGGGMSNVPTLYDELATRLPTYVLGSECETPIRQAIHGDSSGVRGAAWLAQDRGRI